MPTTKFLDERELATFAKRCRKAAGRNRAEAARELGVSRPSVFSAEEHPEMSLTKLRSRMIEAFSDFRVIGPVFLLEEKGTDAVRSVQSSSPKSQATDT